MVFPQNGFDRFYEAHYVWKAAHEGRHARPEAREMEFIPAGHPRSTKLTLRADPGPTESSRNVRGSCPGARLRQRIGAMMTRVSHLVILCLDRAHGVRRIGGVTEGLYRRGACVLDPVADPCELRCPAFDRLPCYRSHVISSADGSARGYGGLGAA